MELIDIGVNLTNRSFRKDREEVVDRAFAAGVKRLVLTGTSVQGSRAALELAQGDSRLYSTAGVHPHDAKSCDVGTIDALRALASSDRCKAVGECGLDFNRDFSPRPVQEQWFEAQIELAAELKMPLFMHERDAHGRFVEILTRHRSTLTAACVHCFTGTGEELDRYLELDLHIGITGWICDERRGRHLAEIVGRIPEDRLMLETDAPYLLPRTMRPKPKGGRNEPAFLPAVLDAVAAARDANPTEVAAATTRTAADFFKLG